MPIVASIGGLIAAVVFLGAVLATGVICAMKGKWWFFALGWFFGIFWIVGAIRIAKPNSRWAKTRYGPNGMEKARERFPRR